MHLVLNVFCEVNKEYSQTKYPNYFEGWFHSLAWGCVTHTLSTCCKELITNPDF